MVESEAYHHMVHVADASLISSSRQLASFPGSITSEWLRRQRESGILPTLACGVIGKRPEQKCNTLHIVQLSCYPKSWGMPTHNSQFSHLLSLLMLLICESVKGYHTLCFCNFSVHILEGEKLGMSGWVIKTLMQSRPGNEARQLCCNSVWKLKVCVVKSCQERKKKNVGTQTILQTWRISGSCKNAKTAYFHWVYSERINSVSALDSNCNYNGQPWLK